ncbi:TraR/DksA family transcriptional regulator [Aliiruegeria lutimaris]|uniref:Transcriptional regulator, TraR/DksA family n=1 Tax=Aliiruegeria lutimaris TaxID=571298 RepID=A0A1G8J1C0_9RHOB|nr:TraR/DksA C4-type zinc finger protein [Aliiruegeria lutimaris]SDI25108.1 transcriptional regulator, TraR/DksA family [Aliiruegeria lutimaris]
MTEADIHRRLNDLLVELDAEDAASAGARSVVELDQSATGRLSRMDALQHQAMAQAQQRRRAAERLRIRAALERLAEGEYGFCTDCGEEIAAARLATDPAIARCADCTRGT